MYFRTIGYFKAATYAFIGLFLSGCFLFTFDEPVSDTKIETNSLKFVTEKTIPAEGGTIVVEDGGSLNGFIIEIPKGSYSTAQTFEISTSQITSHDMGENFHPISPMIHVKCDGGYADSLMEISIPIALTSGDIPMGFYYNDNGTLEAIPVYSYSENSITLLTRHFAPAASLSTENAVAKSTNILDQTCNIVVSSLAESVFESEDVIQSGFKIGTDNWEFTNYGSYIAPGGHCAGQNMAAMWYYYEKKLKGEDDLNKLYSAVDNLWQDNALGYRFCSVVQNDLSGSGYVAEFFWKYMDRNQELDRTKFMTLASAMLITGEPQGVGIYKQSGTRKDGSPIYSGHDLICYKVSMKEQKLYICDPNYPNDERSISLKNDRFEPIPIAINGNAPEYMFPYITWYAKTAWIEWNQISNRFDEVQDLSIGSNPPNSFPSYTIWSLEKAKETDITLADQVSFTINSDTLRCIIECPSAERFWDIDGKKRIDFEVYSITGQKLDVNEQDGKRYVLLEPGLNKLGFYIFGWRSGYQYSNKTDIPLFIDFKWLDVYSTKEESEISACIVSWKILCELDVISGTYRDTIQDYAYAGSIEIPLTKIGANTYESDFHYTFFDDYVKGTFKLTIHEKSNVDIEMNVTDSYLDGVQSTYKKVYKYNATNIPYDLYLSAGENNPGGFRLWSEDFLDHISNFEYHEVETYKTGDKPTYTKELVKTLKSTGYSNNFIEVTLH